MVQGRRNHTDNCACRGYVRTHDGHIGTSCHTHSEDRFLVSDGRAKAVIVELKNTSGLPHA